MWSAPYRASKPISGAITIPGSKSVTNRALVLSALASSPSTLRKGLRSRDTDLMIKALSSLGVTIKIEEDLWKITPAPLMGPASIDVGNAGTVMRFLPPLASLAKGLISFDGDPRSHQRPLGPVIKALENLGVSIEHQGRYSLPMVINGAGYLTGGEVEIDASSSSQFLSSLLLVAPLMKQGLRIKNTGKYLPSKPHIEMTIAMLAQYGSVVDTSIANQWSVEPTKLSGVDLVIEPDLSNAAVFMAAPILCGGEVIIKDWPRRTTQPGDQLRQIFSEMGGVIDFVDQGLRVRSTGQIRGIDIDLGDVGELTPVIAALACFADSPSHLRGIGHLRLHETDRLSALKSELTALGAEVIEEESALRIHPKPMKSGVFHTYEDHRLATAGALIGLAVDGVEVENIETTKKTITDFPALWSQLLNG
ncbi:MAG: 3-phosphoshikimate 1-carboxyvinyltransferase [Actinobacteria bacterium]|nr:3-phosphoshikimate 1-carboxyvinyltransferase [Actinomycetota bacterium]